MMHVIDLVSWKLFLVFCSGSACKIYSIHFTFAGEMYHVRPVLMHQIIYIFLMQKHH